MHMGILAWQSILAYALGISLLFLLARLFIWPLKIVMQLIGNALVGLFLLFAFNVLGSFAGLYVPPNPITVLIVGFLGVPGLLLLIVLKYIV